MTGIRTSFELAAKAADELERRGWTQGTLAGLDESEKLDSCKVCVLGAIGAAYFGDPTSGYAADGTYQNLIDEIAYAVTDLDPKYFDLYERLYTWNDKHASMKEDPGAYVIARLRDYAAQAPEVAA